MYIIRYITIASLGSLKAEKICRSKLRKKMKEVAEDKRNVNYWLKRVVERTMKTKVEFGDNINKYTKPLRNMWTFKLFKVKYLLIKHIVS